VSALAFDLVRRFENGATVKAALTVPEEGVTVLFGPSGAGKTTVLRCIAGLDKPSSGFIRLGGETWVDERRFVSPQRRRVGLLFQDQALFPHLTALENVRFGAADVAATRQAIGLLRIEALLDRSPAQLSGGEKQRVALARAIAARPRAMLLDEPLSAIDAPSRVELRPELRALLLSMKVPVLLVTHDRIEAMALGDRLAVLADGVRQVGPVHEVFSAPRDLAVARVVGTENVAPARVVGREGELVRVQVGAAQLLAVDTGVTDEAFACIRAEEVLLERAPQAATSARNELAGVVRSVAAEGPLVRVVVECGFSLVALVTRLSVESLQLEPGARVAALIKAPAIRLVPR
jgi:molybdate transport system ATP-binding protein